jgi:hypothetical protein
MGGRGRTRRGPPPLIRPWVPRLPYTQRLNTIVEEEEPNLPLWRQHLPAHRSLPLNELFNNPANLHIRIPRNRNNNDLYVSPVSPESSFGGTRKRRVKKRSKTRRGNRR